MKIHDLKKKKNNSLLVLIGLSFIFFMIVMSSVLFLEPQRDSREELYDLNEINTAAGIQPNLTRTDYPIVLNNDSNGDIWQIIYGYSVKYLIFLARIFH